MRNFQIDLGGEIFSVCFTWRALGDLRVLYPDMGVQDMLQSMNPYIIADMIVCGTNGRAKKEALLDLDIPLFPIVDVLDKAITAAYLGEGALEDESGSDPAPDDTKKNTKSAKP